MKSVIRDLVSVSYFLRCLLPWSCVFTDHCNESHFLRHFLQHYSLVPVSLNPLPAISEFRINPSEFILENKPFYPMKKWLVKIPAMEKQYPK